MNRFAVFIALSLCLAIALPAALAEAKLPEKDAKRLDELIAKLGDDDFQTREKADKAIEKEFGKKALAALKVARKHKDLEIAARAKGLIARIDTPRASAGPIDTRAAVVVGEVRAEGAVRVMINGGVVAMGGNGTRSVKMRTVSNAEGTVTVRDVDGRITVTIRGNEKDAKEKTYKADSREAFKKKFPAIYKKHLGMDDAKKPEPDKPVAK
jgi:hypothetical protein